MYLSNAKIISERTKLNVRLENNFWVFYTNDGSELSSFCIKFSIPSGEYSETIKCESENQAREIAKAMQGIEVFAFEHLTGSPTIVAV